MLLTFLKKIRSPISRLLKPASKYVLFSRGRFLEPLSAKYGFDRGTPIDRAYIETFLSDNSLLIKGICLEIHDNGYTKKYGQARVTQSDVIDIDKKNLRANIHADLRNLDGIKNDKYDCIILTHTLGLIDDHEAAIRECLRILKFGGSLLITVSAMGVAANPDQAFWRYTPASLKYLLGKYVRAEQIRVTYFGNVLSGQGFWVGLSAEELTKEELLHKDPRYPVVVAGVVTK